MCGIVGYIGEQEAYPILIKGLHRLEYRGYDSAGVSMINAKGDLNVYKATGKVKALEDKCANEDVTGSIGIAITKERGTSYDYLFRHADRALYKVKDAGRDGFQIYEKK